MKCILLYVLNKFNRNLVEWFKEFLQDRTQRVVIGNTFLEPLFIFSGAPQGGVIGPHL